MTVIDMTPSGGASGPRFGRLRFLGVPFDRIGQAAALERLAARGAGRRFRYVVTPNVDHVVSLAGDPGRREIYENAWLSLCDSKPLWALARLAGVPLEHATGSDLTARLFEGVIGAGDRVAMIAANERIGDVLRARFREVEFFVHVPPAGVLDDPRAFEDCVRFVVGRQARFVFLAIGAPQSERIAHAASLRPGATGTALCIGASLEFVTGMKTRAPKWMRAAGLEWLHRLVSEPRRLWRRYVFSVVPLAGLFIGHWRSRPGPGAAGEGG